LFQKHWWIAGTIGASIIFAQLTVVHLTGSPSLGTDSTQSPFIQFTTINVPFYLKSLFAPWSFLANNNPPSITLSSILAVIGCILAFLDKSSKARYCAWMLLTSMFTLVFIFGWRDERYIYPILPVYYLMAGYALLRISHAIWTFPRTYHVFFQSGRNTSVILGNGIYIRMIATLTFIFLCASVLISAALPLNGYNLFLSRQLGITSHVHYPDYVGIGQYMQQHYRKGDIVISIIPDVDTLYYVGHSDYFFSLNRSLFLFERNGQIVDTSIGSSPLLNQADFLAAINQNKRVWILSDNGVYQNAVLKQFTLPPSFHLVYSGYASAIFLSEG